RPARTGPAPDCGSPGFSLAGVEVLSRVPDVSGRSAARPRGAGPLRRAARREMARPRSDRRSGVGADGGVVDAAGDAMAAPAVSADFVSDVRLRPGGHDAE